MYIALRRWAASAVTASVSPLTTSGFFSMPQCPRIYYRTRTSTPSIPNPSNRYAFLTDILRASARRHAAGLLFGRSAACDEESLNIDATVFLNAHPKHPSEPFYPFLWHSTFDLRVPEGSGINVPISLGTRLTPATPQITRAWGSASTFLS
ncbi:hypothetical protein BC834DRAFT_900415 [Gloeopeniophorella convolvens]|nr:hypothetical protein BC834DRAFT_900415 [Gloeopeniophorella convolvens]